jgi:hypothetical protein
VIDSSSVATVSDAQNVHVLLLDDHVNARYVKRMLHKLNVSYSHYVSGPVPNEVIEKATNCIYKEGLLNNVVELCRSRMLPEKLTELKNISLAKGNAENRVIYRPVHISELAAALN